MSTAIIPPPWQIDDAHSQVKPGRWYKGMPSPNRTGRPRGIVDKRSKVTQALMDEGLAIAKVVTDAALEGDLSACGIVLARIAPAIRPETRPVEFSFDPEAPITNQIEAVLVAISCGAVPVDIGKQIIDAIGTLANARATEELEHRIAMLEEKEGS